MPVHFNSFIADNDEKLKTKLFSDIITKYTAKADDIFVTNDKVKIHMTTYFKDLNSKENIGKVVLTLITREKSIELVDVDIVLLNNQKTKLHFEEKLEQSSESNEYYLVYDLENNRHFDIETVNRYCIDTDLVGQNKEVYLSAFPDQLSLFDTKEEMNKFLGLGKEIDIPGIGKKVVEMDSKMMSDGRMFTSQSDPCSFIIGQVKDFKDIITGIAGNIVKFKIINLETGVGNIPVAVNEDNFDLQNLKKSSFIAMVASIKADFNN